MKVNELKYLRRYNLGNYEHEEIQIGVAVDEGENPSDTLAEMMKFVSTRGIAPVMGKNEAAVTTEPPKAPAPVANEAKPKGAAKKATKLKVIDSEDSSQAKEEIAEEKSKAEAPKKKFKPTATKYDRGNETHKKLLGDLLDKTFPTWRKNPAKAKEASAALESADFLDGDGAILDSFKEALKEKMG